MNNRFNCCMETMNFSYIISILYSFVAVLNQDGYDSGHISFIYLKIVLCWNICNFDHSKAGVYIDTTCPFVSVCAIKDQVTKADVNIQLFGKQQDRRNWKEEEEHKSRKASEIWCFGTGLLPQI